MMLWPWQLDCPVLSISCHCWQSASPHQATRPNLRMLCQPA